MDCCLHTVGGSTWLSSGKLCPEHLWGMFIITWWQTGVSLWESYQILFSAYSENQNHHTRVSCWTCRIVRLPIQSMAWPQRCWVQHIKPLLVVADEDTSYGFKLLRCTFVNFSKLIIWMGIPLLDYNVSFRMPAKHSLLCNDAINTAFFVCAATVVFIEI